ncbi:hypothetical protein [Bacteroides sp.]|uniref:hypothetical protein n=1 Tax=Bacteroides sp. TaxID=29523 RepID=UPI0026221BD8|nr:hypothetical protein [Bacteroides sp.]MDD3041234.1 hypothetical protein [Bacteroides sp.]
MATGGHISMIVEIACHISIIVEINGIIGFEKGVVVIKYKDAIIEIVGKIRSEKTLKRIYKFVTYLYTHETGS